MSDQFPSLAKVMERHSFWLANHSSIGSEAHCRCGFRPRDWWAWSEHVEQVWREACTVTTVEQLDALPDGTFVRFASGLICEKDDFNNVGDGPWFTPGCQVADASNEVPLPARVIHNPDWETK